MPFVQIKVSAKLSEEQKSALGSRITSAVGQAFGKPASYIMLSLEEEQQLYMAGRKLELGAFISVRLLGAAGRSACARASSECAGIMEEVLGVQPQDLYVSFHPVDNWAQGGSLF